MSPDGSGKPPPEERLLTLIRGRPVGQSPSGPVAVVSARSHEAAGGRGRQRAARLFPWSRVAVWVLGVMVLAEISVGVIQLVHPLQVPRQLVVDHQLSDQPDAESEPVATLPSLSDSMSRPLFTLPTPPPTGPAVPSAPPAPTISASQVTARLKLMGIVPGDPIQAIFEDTQIQRTLFVRVGQVVIEGAVLDQVLEDRVTLKLEQETIELAL